MAGAFHGPGEGDCVINVGVSGPGVILAAAREYKGQPINVLADGMVINPTSLITEMNNIHEKGVKDFKLMISKRATLLMPYHVELDIARENALGEYKIGTTKNGIGPCYEDRAARLSIRVGDLLYPEFLKE